MKYAVYEIQKKGSRNNQVLQIQRSLPIWSLDKKFTFDGIYGKGTENAVKLFQKQMGLVSDGIVGEVTAKVLGVWEDVVEGFDVSHWNKIDWLNYDENLNLKFINIKCTEGATFVDPECTTNISNALECGLDVGVYHFTKFQNDPRKEATFFYKQVMDYSFFISSMYLDLEYRTTNLNNKEIYDWAITFLNYLSSITPDFTKVGIYTSNNYILEKKLQSVFTQNILKYDLWAANWSEQPIVYPWDTWNTWQYTSRGQLPFVEGDVDLNLKIK